MYREKTYQGMNEHAAQNHLSLLGWIIGVMRMNYFCNQRKAFKKGKVRDRDFWLRWQDR